MKRRWNKSGFVEWAAVAGIAMIGAFTVSYLLYANKKDPGLAAEARFDLKLVMDRLLLALASESECQQIFTSAPLNALTFTDGDVGTVAMDLTSLEAYSKTIAAVGETIAGGEISKIWLENYAKAPDVGPYHQHFAKFKIQARSGAFSRPVSESFNIGVLVDNNNKIQYCFLDESIALKTCMMTGGYYDPAQGKCKFNFTDRECDDPKSCVTGIYDGTEPGGHQIGELKCSKQMQAPPRPPPPPLHCFCACTRMFAVNGERCGQAGPLFTTAGWCLIDQSQPGCINSPECAGGPPYSPPCEVTQAGSYDWTGCILSSTPPEGC